MKILSVENRPCNGNGWSFSLTVDPVWKYIKEQGHIVARIPHQHVSKSVVEQADIIFYQNTYYVNPLTFIPEKSVIRIGSVHPFNTSHIKSCRSVIVTNNALLQSVMNIRNKDVYLIPNGLDLEEWQFIEDIPLEFTAGYVAWHGTEHYKQQKGYNFVVAACELAGVKLKTAIYPGTFRNHDEMREFYKEINCLILPSVSEGCNNSVMEALACGRPVLITKAGYHGEMLKDRENCIFINRSAEAIATAIKQLQNDCQCYDNIRLNGRLFAEEYHSHIQTAEAYLKAFRLDLPVKQITVLPDPPPVPSTPLPKNYDVSIIMPAWKTSEFIEEALDSLQRQNLFKSHKNYEILVGIDNCLETRRKLEQIADKYENLRIFWFTENVGPYVIRNTLMYKEAKYDNLFLFDSDDVASPMLVYELLNAMDSNVDMIRYEIIRFSDDPLNNQNNTKKQMISNGTVLITKMTLEKFGGYQPWRCAADWELIYRMGKHGGNIKIIRQPLAYARKHPQSLTVRETTNMKSKLRAEYHQQTLRIKEKKIEPVFGEYICIK